MRARFCPFCGNMYAVYDTTPHNSQKGLIFTDNYGSFTLPGEAGYEQLTLALAKRWGADIIRDSDGTKLSPEILDAGYGVYSTICPIREHNEWIKGHPDARQHTFLCTSPLVALGESLTIPIMADFFAGQFEPDASPDAFAYWQVFDRTTGGEVPPDDWRYNPEAGTVTVKACPWHRYTASFLAWRVWEEISMYNHVTNGWSKEHLLQLNPYHPKAISYLRDWLKDWCDEHPQTTVVRFTSLFYNFAWIWGSSPKNRHLFSDWASYDFSVSPQALMDFEREYGYALTAEDFVREGKYNATHRVPDDKKRDWMDFIGRFVRRAGRGLVEIVHQAGKQAYVFYDDSWVGLEPYSGFFKEFGFDGIIKCVFSGFEVRLCAGVPAKTHELRFHPYLFPVGLGGMPTFSAGGDPARDATQYWISARRALLRAKIERVGLGGYLHLVEGYPDFVDAITNILGEFRTIKQLHEGGAPAVLKPRIGILHAWGALRSWTLSGHFHETFRHVLIHVLESLSGLAFDVRFLSFKELLDGVPEDIDVILNAGDAGTAWSGGHCWQDEDLVSLLTAWVHRGGVFVGVGEPGATQSGDTTLRMSHVLGVDLDNGDRTCHGRWPAEVNAVAGLIPAGVRMPVRENLYLTDGRAQVLAATGENATAVLNRFGSGVGIYLTGFETGAASTRFLQNLLVYAVTGKIMAEGLTDNASTECAVYPRTGRVAFINNSGVRQETGCTYLGKEYRVQLAPYGMEILAL